MDSKIKLLISFGFSSLSGPLVSFLQNVYIWRSLNDITYIIAFNIGLYITIPFGFWLNGKILPRFSNTKLYLFGGVLLGLVNILLILFRIQNQFQIFGLGIMSGLGASFFWANRNNITYKFTHDHNRNWFFATDSIIKSVINIVMPIFYGFVISQLENTYQLSLDNIYLGMALIYMVLVVIGPLIIFFDNKFNFPIVFNNGKIPDSKIWRGVKFNTTQWGLFHEINGLIIPLMVLSYIGKEFELGSIQTLATVVTILVMLYISKYLQRHHRLQVYIIAVLIMAVAAIFNFSTLNSLSVIIYIGISAIASELILVSTEPVALKVIELESAVHKIDASVFLYEREKYYALGRVAGMFLMLAIYLYGGNDFSFRLIMVFIALVQISGILIWRTVAKHVKEVD